jgi:hypothetical protein
MDGISKISVMEKELFPIDLRICVKVVDAPCRKSTGPPDDPMYFIVLGNEKICEV